MKFNDHNQLHTSFKRKYENKKTTNHYDFMNIRKFVQSMKFKLNQRT